MSVERFEEESSCSFLICSVSIFVDSFLIRSMKHLNCCRFRSGPRLKFHRIGRTSVARKSASAIEPTCLKTLRAAIITAGSLVFMALRRGTTFSWTVNLSRAVPEVAGFFGSALSTPESSSSSAAASTVPPHRTTRASRPLTLMPRLLVLLTTVPTTGNRSCFTVVKSSTGRTTDKLWSALSTKLCVLDSMAKRTIGRTSSLNSFPLQCSVHISMFSRTIMRPASFPGSLSVLADLVKKVSRNFGTTFS